MNRSMNESPSLFEATCFTATLSGLCALCVSAVSNHATEGRA
jgi:hypothetical protein